MFRWVSVAPFGSPVVPEVYWMLIGSELASDADRAATSSLLTESALDSKSDQSDDSKNTARSTVGQESDTSPHMAR